KVDISVNTDDTRDISIKGDSIEWTTASLPVSVMLSDEGGGLEELRIFNNGKLVYSEPLKKADAGKEKSCNIELSGGENHITAIALNRERTESLPAEIFVYFDGVEAESDLYILSVGINAYKNPSYQLSFAINDAKEFLQSVKKGSGTIFRNVNVYFVKDGEADKAGISAAFSEIAEKAGSSDVFLFYYAGHGVMSMGREAESKFYIIPYDVTKLYGDDDMLAEKGISASELMEFSRLIKARKQMFILDACQSGGAMDEFAQRGAGREKAIAQLARSTGTYFLAASGAIQYASEASSLGHGLFTWAILEALDGKTEGEAGDMKVTANELKSYVEDRVPELTEKYRGTPQYPTGFGYGQDFPIVIVK
ncbi:MAG: caspase family protein, partial [Bacteroidota bacterium]